MNIHKLTLSLIVSTAVLSGSLHAQTTWVGGSGLNWSTAANWSPATAPITGVTALLNDTGANRTIVYDASASGALGTLTMTQTSAFTNALDVQKNLTIATATTLSATGGGTSLITVDPVGSDRALTFTNGLNVNSGGKLALAFGFNAGAGSYLPTVTGNVTLNGGAITVGQSQGTTQATANFNSDLTVSSGTLTVDTNTNTTNASYSRDMRVSVQGNFTATGGSLVTTNAGNIGSLQLFGSANSFSNFTYASNYGLSLMRSGDQTLTGLPLLTTGNLVVRGSGTKTISSSIVGSNVSNLQVINQSTTGALVAVKLGSDLTQTSGTAILQMTTGAASGTNTANGVDANGHTLDLSLATGASNAKGPNGEWKPNHAGSATGTTWALSSSAANGVIKAKGFDFTAANVTTTVGANLTLESTGGTSIANNLGSGTAFNTASTFKYSGSGTATLASGRSIGTLLVSSGTLQASGTTFAAATAIQVSTGAVLDYSTVALTSPSLNLGINGASAGQVKTSTSGGYVYSGNLTLNFATTAADNSVFDLFNFTLGQTPTGTFSGVALTGIYTATLTDLLSNGVWTGSVSGKSFSFSQSTGDLTVVPEPSTVITLLMGVSALGALRIFRRRRM